MQSQLSSRICHIGMFILVACMLVVLSACTVTFTPVQTKNAGVVSVASPGTTPAHLIILHSGLWMFALDATNGNVVWKQERASFAQPVVANGQAYTLITPAYPANQNQIVDIDSKSGTQRWVYSLPNAQNTPFGALAYQGNVLIAAIQPGSIIGLNATTGTLLWKDTINFVMWQQQLNISNNNLFLALPDGNVDAINIADGKLRWTKNVNGSASMTAGQGTTFVANTCYNTATSSFNICLTGFDSTTGATTWNATVQTIACGTQPGCTDSPTTLSVSGNILYVLYSHITNDSNNTPYRDQGINAFNLSNHTLLWNYVIPGSHANMMNDPRGFALDGADAANVYIESSAGALTAVSAANHKMQWSYTNPSGVSDQFTLDQGTAYIVNGSVATALNTQNGTQLWTEALMP